MAMRMLIDATHAEETRVVAVRGNRLEEFDFETSTKKQLKGNIYLAKVTRVEPSLQAAFVEYGGNRHGFLAFNEIHPDYYQIPVADREELLQQHAQEERAAAEAEGAETALDDENAESSDEENKENGREPVESLGGDELDEVSPRRPPAPRTYKIQEVIKRRQILLVQVAKEERGNKGAALTTYLSLAGRYCVLMPNTARGGGISRKIVNPADRKRLKGVAESLEVPEGMGVIIRTAGMKRSKAEIKRDYEYLLRLWDNIRNMTLQSTAPALIYEEADLIKRSIRDLYNKDIEEVLVEGEEGYRAAKDFMRMLMPSHAKQVKRYKDRIPLYHRYQVEQQFDSMYSADVTLKSGGYIVINPTEALVSIDVNSGKSTKERNIEETAYKTNLEAAEEIARQLRLRDLAGLIVIDFIDMDHSQNNRNVERRLKECLKADRARIQVGRISPFGLLEMSRQRLRPSLLEASTDVCPHCAGAGVVRSTESTVLHVLRAIEEEGIRERSAEVTVTVPTRIALYLLNQKRDVLHEIEERYAFKVLVTADDELIPPAYRLERAGTRPSGEIAAVEVSETEVTEEVSTEGEEEAEETTRKRSRRRRRRRPRGERTETTASTEEQTQEPSQAAEEPQTSDKTDATSEAGGESLQTEEGEPKKRRRSRRGGRRRSRPDGDSEAAVSTAKTEVGAEAKTEPVASDAASTDETSAKSEPEPPKRRRTRRKPAAKTVASEESGSAPEPASKPADEGKPVSTSPTSEPVSPSAPLAANESEAPVSMAAKPAASPRPAKPVEAPAAVSQESIELEDNPEKEKPSRRGWWRRRLST